MIYSERAQFSLWDFIFTFNICLVVFEKLSLQQCEVNANGTERYGNKRITVVKTNRLFIINRFKVKISWKSFDRHF